MRATDRGARGPGHCPGPRGSPRSASLVRLQLRRGRGGAAGHSRRAAALPRPRPAAALAALALLAAARGGGGDHVSPPPAQAPPTAPPRAGHGPTYRPSGHAAAGDVFVHLFEWRWPDVATEC